MDSQVDQFLEEYVAKTLNGSGFSIYSPQEKEDFKTKLNDYFSDLIFTTMMDNLTEDQLAELGEFSDLGSEDAQNKIALMSASIPGFIFLLKAKFQEQSEEIGRTGQIPDLKAQFNETPQTTSI